MNVPTIFLTVLDAKHWDAIPSYSMPWCSFWCRMQCSGTSQQTNCIQDSVSGHSFAWMWSLGLLSRAHATTWIFSHAILYICLRQYLCVTYPCGRERAIWTSSPSTRWNQWIHFWGLDAWDGWVIWSGWVMNDYQSSFDLEMSRNTKFEANINAKAQVTRFDRNIWEKILPNWTCHALDIRFISEVWRSKVQRLLLQTYT